MPLQLLFPKLTQHQNFGDVKLEGAPHSGTERPPLLNTRGTRLMPRGSRVDAGRGFEAKREKRYFSLS